MQSTLSKEGQAGQNYMGWRFVACDFPLRQLPYLMSVGDNCVWCFYSMGIGICDKLGFLLFCLKPDFPGVRHSPRTDSMGREDKESGVAKAGVHGIDIYHVPSLNM